MIIVLIYIDIVLIDREERGERREEKNSSNFLKEGLASLASIVSP